MPRFVAIDWDHGQLHAVAGSTASGGVRVQRAALWQEALDPTAVNLEEQGSRLRQRLKEAGIAPAPVLACIGRDRLIVKELRIPAVPAHEEPAIVRFQAIKELTDAPDDVVIDYMAMGDVGTERRIAVIVAKREIVRAYQALCKAAGLKLEALTPRPFGGIAALRRLAGTTVLTPAVEPGSTVALLTVGDAWAELCVARDDSLMLARALTLGNGLPGEVRRTLAIHASQSPQAPIKALYLAATAEPAALRSRLEDMLGVPIHPFDPFAGADQPEFPTPPRGTFAGAVGLLHLKAGRAGLPINFCKPREPKPVADPNKRRLYIGVAAAAALLVAGFAYCYIRLAGQEAQLETLALRKATLGRDLLKVDEDNKRIKALSDWEDMRVSWLDEFYDLTHRFPDPDAVRITEFKGDPKTRTAKDPHIAKLMIKGITGDRKPVDDLITAMDRDKRYRWESNVVSRNSQLDRRQFPQMFTTKLEVEKVDRNQYVRQLPPPSAERLAAQAGRNGQRGRDRGLRGGPPGDFGGFGGFGGMGGFGGDQE